MPCYNEVTTIKIVAERVLESPYVLELVIVDDGSTDGTLEAARGIEDPRVRVFAQSVNLGKGAALRRGFASATGQYVIVQDADLEYDPAEYPTVLAPLLDGSADVVFGSRFHTHRPRRVLYYWHAVGNRFLTTMSNMFTNLNLSDMETCYKAFRAEVLRDIVIEEDRFGFEPEITAKVARGGWRVYEVGISYSGRTYAEGKKIGWRDGVRATYGIVRYSAVWERLRSRLTWREVAAPAGFDAADAELATVLDSLGDARNYNKWIYDLCAPHLGEDVLEIGAGHGELTEHLRRGRRLTATDASPRCVAALETRFADDVSVEVRQCTGTSLDEHRRWDSAVLVNVLEHIDDDIEALRDLGSQLRAGGRVVVFVPAFESLRSDFDRRIGHRRRYRKSTLVEALDKAGLRVIDARYVNSVGAIAWWTLARQLRQTPTQSWSVRVYDKLGVPLVRRYEAAHAPAFGQSLLAVAERPGTA
jgi:2-polyprenyl-3-methyl-5-hydroxy-6-metoxy-1,4-benzoquinol methylase